MVTDAAKAVAMVIIWPIIWAMSAAVIVAGGAVARATEEEGFDIMGVGCSRDDEATSCGGGTGGPELGARDGGAVAV